MAQDRLDYARRVALDVGQQFIPPAGVAGLRMAGPPGGVHDPPHEQEVLAVLRDHQRPDRIGTAAAGGERGQRAGGNLVSREVHGRRTRREARSATRVSRMWLIRRKRSGLYTEGLAKPVPDR